MSSEKSKFVLIFLFSTSLSLTFILRIWWWSWVDKLISKVTFESWWFTLTDRRSHSSTSKKSLCLLLGVVSFRVEIIIILSLMKDIEMCLWIIFYYTLDHSFEEFHNTAGFRRAVMETISAWVHLCSALSTHSRPFSPRYRKNDRCAIKVIYLLEFVSFVLVLLVDVFIHAMTVRVFPAYMCGCWLRLAESWINICKLMISIRKLHGIWRPATIIVQIRERHLPAGTFQKFKLAKPR